MKPKPLESLNHLTVPVAIKNFQIKTNHTSHKSKKLLAPSSACSLLINKYISTCQCLHCWCNNLVSQAVLRHVLQKLSQGLCSKLLIFAIGPPSARSWENA